MVQMRDKPSPEPPDKQKSKQREALASVEGGNAVKMKVETTQIVLR